MAKSIEVWVDSEDFQKSKTVERELPALGEGEVRLAIEMFGLTSNNVGYALSGKSIGYYGYFPAEDNWAKVPVWGCAHVTESNHNGITVGERLYGFFPMASHVDLKPGVVKDNMLIDAAEPRQNLPDFYNIYQRMATDPDIMKGLDVERSLLFPLFATSFILYDYLVLNEFFGAQQVVIGSVSSKTGFGLAQLLKQDTSISQKIVGVTSAGNAEFVEGLGSCDQVVIYGNESEIDASLSTAYIDMSGDVRLTTDLHNHIGENIVESCIVGGTHWNAMGKRGKLPGAKPAFFFAPGHIAMREKEWGQGAMFERGFAAGVQISQQIGNELSIEWTKSAEGLRSVWADILDNKISGRNGQMISLLDD